MIPEELLHYKLPRGYKPGTDRISKIVAKNQFTIDLITTSLLNFPAGTYTTGNSMFIDGTEFEILYLPRSADLTNLSPVVVEIQHTLTREFMCRAVQYCLNVYKRFHIFSIFFIVYISKTECKALGKLFKPYLLETPCCHFATGCFILTKQSIDPFINNPDINALDPLVAFAHFLTSGQPRITKLYLVAKIEATTPMELPKDFDGASCSTNSKNKSSLHLSIQWSNELVSNSHSLK